MKRKVAIFLNQHLPLSEVFIAQQATSLRTYAPTLVACRSISPSVQHNLPVAILNESHTLSEKISETVFKLTGHNQFLKSAIAGSDILHAHFGPTGWLAAPLSRQTGIPLVVTLHGFDVLKNMITLRDDGLMQVLYQKFLGRLTRQASLFICNSDYLKARAIQFGFPAEKCVVNYLGIPLPEWTIPKQTRTDKNAPFRILSVGRMVPMKGHSLLIDAVSMVQEAGFNVQLDIVGAGPLRNELEEKAKAKLKNFKFWGGVPHEQIMSLMRQSDIYCHLSHQTENGYNEAFGLAVLEAQWAGLPVVAFKSGGVPEAMADGITGFGCTENNISEVAQSIINLIKDDDLRLRMGHAAPKFVKENFDSQILTGKLEKIYDEVLVQK